MNYKGKKIGLTGYDGFIGQQLLQALTNAGAHVSPIVGDVRRASTFRNVDYKMDYLFHFADPSSQILFKRQPMYAAEVTIQGFVNAARVARENGVKLIYPSTGLLSQDRFNEYAMCKKICEDIHIGENLDAIGIRIFATYGPTENHKRDYASVPFLFARDMFYGKPPEIFGDGNQKRDFIYIEDCVAGILEIAETANEPIVDLGSGEATSFNELIDSLQAAYKALSGANFPKPVYIDKPGGYVDETLARPNKYYKPVNTITDGVYKLVREMINNAKSDSNHND